MIDEVYGQIKSITRMLIENNISTFQNFPKRSGNEIVWENFQNIAFDLKDSRYDEIYIECLRKRDFNFVLLDGSIIQLKYRFKREHIESHVLLFFPNPQLEKYQDNPDEFEQLYYGNTLFTDINNTNLVYFPLRFDFDTKATHVDMDHPVSHSTLGNYFNCRIPVGKPISPFRFMQFILRNFYFNIYKEKLSDNLFRCDLRFVETISDSEKKLIHFNYTL